MSKEQKPSIDTIISQLKNDTANDVTIGGYTFKELSYEQQRKLINNGASPIEFRAAVNNILDEFIIQCVEYADDMASIAKSVTIVEKPFLITKLRTLNFGDEYKKDNKVYKFYNVTEDDLAEKDLKPLVIERGSLTITLTPPTLETDIHFNKILIQALSDYKNRQLNKITETEGGDIYLRYQTYELMKYISSFEYDGQEYTFIDLAPRSCVAFMDVLKTPIIKEIVDYKNQIEELSAKTLVLTNVDNESDTIKLDNLAEIFTIDLDENVVSF